MSEFGDLQPDPMFEAPYEPAESYEAPDSSMVPYAYGSDSCPDITATDSGTVDEHPIEDDVSDDELRAVNCCPEELPPAEETIPEAKGDARPPQAAAQPSVPPNPASPSSPTATPPVVPDVSRHPNNAEQAASLPQEQGVERREASEDADSEETQPQTTLDKILGHVEVPSDDGAYDERRQIVAEARGAVENLRNNMRAAAARLGIEVSEEEVEAWEPPDEQVAQLRQELAPQRKRLAMIRGAETYIEDQAAEAHRRGVALRPHQQDGMRDFADFLVHDSRTTPQGGKAGLFDMATGVGKTPLFVNVVAALKHYEDPDDPISVLVLTPTKIIKDQTIGADGKRGFGKFAPDQGVGEHSQEVKHLTGDVDTMLDAGFNILMAAGKMPHYDVVVVDEAHTVLGRVTSDNIRAYCADKLSIGLTATPEYEDGRSAHDLFPHLIHRKPFRESVQDGLLAPTRGWLVEARPQIDERTLPADEEGRRAAIRAAQLEARERVALDIVKKELARGVGVIVRCPPGDDVNHAVEFARTLRNTLTHGEDMLSLRWINAAYVGGSTARQTYPQRVELLRLFDEGRLDALTYVNAIGMGMDTPHGKTLINIASASETNLKQAIGRTSRLTIGPDGKPIEAHVYDVRNGPVSDSEYTVLDVLGTQSGELLDHQPLEELPIPEPRTGRHRTKHHEHPEVEEVISTTLGTAAIEHNVEAEIPLGAEVAASLERISPDTVVEHAEACRILGISIVTYKTIMRNVGSNPDLPITYGDLSTILELYPRLAAEPLPADGDYVSSLQVAHDSPRYVRAFSLIGYGRERGIHPQRFAGPDGKVGFYYRRGVARQLLEDYLRDRLR